MGYGKYNKYNKYNNTCNYTFVSDFIKTDVWLNFRDKMLLDRGFSCELCNCSGTINTLNVHHMDLTPANYTNLSNPANFRVLCRKCHQDMHTLYKFLKEIYPKQIIMDAIVIRELKRSFIKLPVY
jgi:hypothetical protein